MAARSHSQDMAESGFFDHRSPTEGGTDERFAKFKIPYTVGGENLARAVDAAEAHRALMQSPGHRANILEPKYERVGIGIVRTNDGILVTQEFAH